ncbi:hypothetical protein MCAL160_0761 [Mycoplasmopsis californica HAZ160_1]|uniref:Transmembrane protein n=1 Tax=Mycoplasmopsis californica HAZ160_1 TaxID=1397850 RepID=A0AAT9F8G2_9BACT|nr:hypothetical protein [Mycoplasmopsis californica]BAP01190.1 hypothetical protein MCAL160_0761 [Mycoplasmopsis californica HAZ160_1]BBG41059.1 hypothetical protein MCAL106_0761 [Mycoplasmopsis californica]BBG41652.1 hypothetical protein MCAL106E_0761 [Mycoplasmopsis californica]BBG42246.1 hypothetical protein MCAL106L_0761 [Mycoplasmopsis californica]BBG42825.1 hypothetical protein MCAL160E_0761 [Mycoplasmopsis californica]
MSKKPKLLFSLGLISSTLLPLISTSTRLDGDAKPSTPVEPNDPSKPGDKPVQPTKTIDPKFDTFAQEHQKILESGLKSAITVAISFLKNEMAKLDADKKIDYGTKISKKVYLSKLINYFTKYQEQIIKEHDKYGFNITFPYALSALKKFQRGNIEFNNKKYSNVLYGTDKDNAKTRYDRIIKKELISNLNQEDNFISEKRFKDTIQNYYTSLAQEIGKIIYSEKHVLKVDDPDNGFHLKFPDKKGNNQEEGKIEISAPKVNGKATTWDDYIKSKILPRFLEFDLIKNQEYKDEEQKQKSPKKPPLIPPLVPGKPILAPPVKADVEALPSLEPQIRAEYVNKSISELNNLINSANQDKFFFFNNPVNTRYVYKVVSIEQSLAKVSIEDINQPSIKRIYTVNFDISKQRDAKKQLIRYNHVQGIREVVIQFYNAVGLDEKLLYQNLANDNLINTVFGMVDQFVKTIYSDNYALHQEEDIKYWSDKLATINDKKTANSAKNSAKNLFLTAVATSTFNTQPTWSALAQVFDSLINEYTQDVFRLNNKTIKSNIDVMNKQYASKLKVKPDYKVETIDEFVDQIQKDVYRLRALANYETLNMVSWFNKYTAKLEYIKKEFLALRDLSNNLAVNEQTYQKFHEAYLFAQKSIDKNKADVKNARFNIGITLLVVASIVHLLFIALMVINYKTFKQRKIRSLYILFLAISIIFFIAGINLMLL